MEPPVTATEEKKSKLARATAKDIVNPAELTVTSETRSDVRYIYDQLLPPGEHQMASLTNPLVIPNSNNGGSSSSSDHSKEHNLFVYPCFGIAPSVDLDQDDISLGDWPTWPLEHTSQLRRPYYTLDHPHRRAHSLACRRLVIMLRRKASGDSILCVACTKLNRKFSEAGNSDDVASSSSSSSSSNAVSNKANDRYLTPDHIASKLHFRKQQVHAASVSLTRKNTMLEAFHATDQDETEELEMDAETRQDLGDIIAEVQSKSTEKSIRDLIKQELIDSLEKNIPENEAASTTDDSARRQKKADFKEKADKMAESIYQNLSNLKKQCRGHSKQVRYTDDTIRFPY